MGNLFKIKEHVVTSSMHDDARYVCLQLPYIGESDLGITKNFGRLVDFWSIPSIIMDMYRCGAVLIFECVYNIFVSQCGKIK